MDIQERIGQVVKFVYGTQSNAARALEVDRQRINGIVNGIKPGIEFIIKLGEKIERLNINWLIFGRGPMFIDWEKLTNEKKGAVSDENLRLEKMINLWENDQILMKEINEKNEQKNKLILEKITIIEEAILKGKQ